MSQLQFKMREAITNLTKQQSIRLEQLISVHNIDSKTAVKTQKYYRELRKIHQYFDQQHYRLEDLMRASIVVAEKSQTVLSLNGQKVRGLGLSLNEMIKTGVSMKKIGAIIKGFMTHSKSIEEELREDLVQVVEQISFGSDFIQKFQRALDYFDFEQHVDSSFGYMGLFRSFTWLFFLQANHYLKISSDCEADYLLISVFYLMTRCAFDYLRPKNAPRIVNKSNNKALITSILQKLFQIFLIDDVQCFKRISSQVDNYFSALIENQTIKCNNFQELDFLNPHLIAYNYKKIDFQYQHQRQRTQGSIDYRLFLQNRHSTLTPTKHTQLQQAKQMIANKKDVKPRSFASHKILTFDMQQSEKQSDSSNKNFEIKLPANVKVSPSYIKTPLICAQQQSPNSSIQHYMNRQVKTNRNKIQHLQNQKQILQVIKRILEGYITVTGKLREKIILTYNYYLAISSKYFSFDQIDLDDINGIHCSFLVHSLLFMISSTLDFLNDNCGEVRQILEYVRNEVCASGYQLWVVNRFLQKESDRVPSQLKDMLVYMENIILQQIVWEDQNSVNQIQNLINNSELVNSIHNANMLKMMDIIMSQIRSQVIKMVTGLDLQQSHQQIETDIYQAIKYVIAITPHMIQGMHLHQIMLCCVYLILKTRDLKFKFNTIINEYQHTNHIQSNQYKRLVNQIASQDEEMNIIDYYNKRFVPYVKHHMQQIKYQSFEEMAEPFKKNIHDITVEQAIKTITHYGRANHSSIGARGVGKHGHLMTEHQSQFQDKFKENRLMTLQSQKAGERQCQPFTNLTVDVEQKLKGEANNQKQERNSTTMRSRPTIGMMANVLKTEKVKSPPVYR